MLQNNAATANNATHWATLHDVPAAHAGCMPSDRDLAWLKSLTAGGTASSRCCLSCPKQIHLLAHDRIYVCTKLLAYAAPLLAPGGMQASLDLLDLPIHQGSSRRDFALYMLCLIGILLEPLPT